MTLQDLTTFMLFRSVKLKQDAAVSKMETAQQETYRAGKRVIIVFCPKCRDEFIEGITECPDCKVPLVNELSVEEGPKYEPIYVDLVTVLESGDTGIIMVAKSLLENAGIRYYAKGETAKNLFGGGTFCAGFNPLTGPAQIQVSKVDLEEALELLKDLLE